MTTRPGPIGTPDHAPLFDFKVAIWGLVVGTILFAAFVTLIYITPSNVSDVQTDYILFAALSVYLMSVAGAYAQLRGKLAGRVIALGGAPALFFALLFSTPIRAPHTKSTIIAEKAEKKVGLLVQSKGRDVFDTKDFKIRLSTPLYRDEITPEPNRPIIIRKAPSGQSERLITLQLFCKSKNDDTGSDPGLRKEQRRPFDVKILYLRYEWGEKFPFLTAEVLPDAKKCE